MGKRLSIKGHPTRAKEVIELLKMMGGDNIYSHWNGDQENMQYFINEQGNIDNWCLMANRINYEVFTLEEFLEKYPFKVGDMVTDITDGCLGIIDKMKWDEDVCDMKYCVTFGNGIDFGWFTNDTIKFYQPENSKDIATTVNETQPKRDIYASEFMITHMMLPKTPHNVNDELEQISRECDNIRV